jgi:hypothetical protein
LLCGKKASVTRYSPAGAGNSRQLLDPDREGGLVANPPVMQLANRLFTLVSGVFAVADGAAPHEKLL